MGGNLTAIARRNEISATGEEAHCLDQEVSVAQTQKRQRDKQAALTTLVSELVTQVQGLVEEVAWMKRQFILQLEGYRGSKSHG